MKMGKKLASLLILAALSAGSTATFAQTADASAPTTASKKATPADRALGKSVRRALSKTQGFDVSGVFVRARGGVVTLSGSVKSGDQIAQAADVAKSVQGVTSVNNKLTLFHGGNG
nr:BON domain-containing protein [Caballeronia sp. BR00000012568055]